MTPTLEDPLAPLLAAGAAGLRTIAAERLAEARRYVADFTSSPAEPGCVAALRGWDAIGEPLNGLGGLAHLFFQAHPDPQVRTAGAEVEQQVQRFATELSLDRRAFERLAALDAAEAPGPVEARLLAHALRDYRRAGVDRDEATRARVQELREELVGLGQDFARNIAADVRHVVIPEGRAGLAGLPDDYVASHAPGPDGAVTISTDPADYLPFLRYAQHRGHREALYRAFVTRGSPQNLAVLQRLLERRHELATLLGYPHWAAYVTEDKMIRTAENAAAFIARVTGLTAGRAEQELEELLAEARRDDPGASVVREFDRAAYGERIRRERFGFDAREMRPYLPFESVRRGVFETAARLYGLQFRPAAVPTWHADVQAWDLFEHGEMRARFFLDLHPRPDKYKHAAMFDLVSGVVGEGGEPRCLPQACLVCNFPRPAGAGDPGLMEPREVVTFFHEFGHLLHHLLAGRQRWLAVSGIATEWDFVEVPSQLFEEWARDPAVLAGFARHHRTGESVPPDLVHRMRAAEDHGKGLATRSQMFYAALSLDYYSRDPRGIDTTEAMVELKRRYLPFPHEEGTSFQTSFGHLDGYSAIYYTYMWSLVLAKDALSAFGPDLMDPVAARRWRDAVLAPGGSKDALDLMADFLGRPHDTRAFEAWLAA